MAKKNPYNPAGKSSSPSRVPGGNYRQPHLNQGIKSSVRGGKKSPYRPAGMHTDGMGGSTQGMGPTVKGSQRRQSKACGA